MTKKQQRFCHEYMVDMNGTQAAIRAGYKETSARVTGSELLALPAIREYINRLQVELSEKTGITAERVLNELAKIGFANVKDYLESGNSIAEISAMDPDKTAAVSMVKKTTTTTKDGLETETVQITMHSKVGALERLGQHLGIFAMPKETVKTVFDIKMTDE